MVKRPRIASKPTTPPPAADSWVNEQIDPEITKPAISPPVKQEPPKLEPQPTEPTAAEKKRLYPHRISFDTDKEQYRRLKRAGFETERALTDIAREAVEDWLKSRGY